MKETDDSIFYKMPEAFRYCILSECPKSSICLRYKAYTNAPSDVQYFSILNPEYLREQDLAQCQHYYAQSLKLFVAGLHGVADNMPQRKFEQVRLAIINQFGRNAYYRFMRYEKWLNEKEQETVKAIFENLGIAEMLVYDKERKGF